MDDILKKIGLLGIVPVVKIENAEDAIPLGKALIDGGLPLAEVTFRTDAAEESIKRLTKGYPDMLVGAGTVLTVEQVRRAVSAGARFIVSPGFNPKVVDYCIENGIPVTPGINSPTQIEMALERNLKVLKFFPAETSGGVAMLKAMSAPYGEVKFIPTGGVNAENLNSYLSFSKVHACGGSWMVKSELIKGHRFEEITRLVREAIDVMLGFGFAHLGINMDNERDALEGATEFSRVFGFPVKNGNSSVFAGKALEITKKKFPGENGHIAIATNYMDRAIYYLGMRGINIKEETKKEKDGKLVAVYLDVEVGGFAIHLVQR